MYRRLAAALTLCTWYQFNRYLWQLGQPEEDRKEFDAFANSAALSWLMMMYAHADEFDSDATAKLEDCYHQLHFGHWPRRVSGGLNYCQECNLFLTSVPGLKVSS